MNDYSTIASKSQGESQDKSQIKPFTVPVNPEGIPAELKQRRQWVWWRWVYRPGNSKPWTKPPYDPKSRNGQFVLPAKSNKPSTWDTFDNALKGYQEDEYGDLDGIGFVPRKEDPYTGIDLDNCIDETGKVALWASDIITAINSYTELSPSGKGVRIFVKAKLPGGGKKRGSIEVYDRKHYLTVTGRQLPNTPCTIEDRQQEVEALYQQLVKEQDTSKEPTRESNPDDDNSENSNSESGLAGVSLLTDEEVLDRAKNASNGTKFLTLWTGVEAVKRAGLLGKDKRYPSQSEADQALCNLLAFWCANDAEQMDRLFRRSGLYREEKWDKVHHGDGRTYGEGTIQKAIDATPKPYSPALRTTEEEVIAALALDPFDPGKLDPLPAVAGVAVASSRFLTVNELAKLPPASWQVHNHFTENSLVVLYGESGSLKTFTALDYGLCIATGKSYLDTFFVKQGKVLYVCSEGLKGAYKRINAWQSHYGISAPDTFLVLGEGLDFIGKEDVKKLLADVKAAFNGNPDLIVVDTLARNFGSGDENTQRDMNLFVASCDVLRQSGATVLVVHHSGKDANKRERGSTVLRGAADTRIELARAGDLLIVKCLKQKDDVEFEPYNLKVTPIAGSLVLLKTDEAPTREDSKPSNLDVWKAIVDSLKKQPMNRDELYESTGFAQNRIEQATPVLKSAGVIESKGKPRKFHLTETYDIALANLDGFILS